jgi:drug/metabolite transporter (DMT)-like permease
VSGATPSGGEAETLLLSNALMAVAVVAYGAYAVQGRALRSGERYPAVVATTASFAVGLLFLLPLTAGEVFLFGAPELGPRGWLVLVYLGAAATALAMLLWKHALRYVPASTAALYVSLVPVVGLGFALLIGEHVSVAQLVGGALAVAGVLLGDAIPGKERRRRRARSGTG